MSEQPLAPRETLDPEAISRLRRIGGPKLVIELIDLFFEGIPARIDVALRAALDEELEAVAEELHAAKASAGILGAWELQQRAERIEKHARYAEADCVRAELPALRQVLERTLAALQSLREEL